MKAVILVGGEGTRLRPLTYDIPKPMVPILNKPFMEHMLDLLKKHGIKEVVFSSGYKVEAFMEHFFNGEKLGLKLDYVVEEFPLGTAGAVKNVEKFIDGTFLVFNGDILTDADLTSLIKYHREKKGIATLTLTPVDNPTIYGVIETDQNNRIQKFIEKPSWDRVTSNYINAGIYVLEPVIFKEMKPDKNYSFERQIYPDLLERGDLLFAYKTGAYWLDIGSPEKYMKANQDALLGNIKLETHLKREGSGILLGDSSSIGSKASLEPPIAIGKNCVISKGAQIGKLSVIGNSCKIESGAVVKSSIVWDNTIVEKSARLENCIIGRNCLIGEEAVIESGAIIASSTKIEPGKVIESGVKVG
ncbi:MAG: NDP-sugar synthase [Firmicutes bacterium]|nr:NDP-sugar synthase [Bacillota bacterium]